MLFFAFIRHPDGLDHTLLGQKLDLVRALVAALDRFCRQHLGIILFSCFSCRIFQLDRMGGYRQTGDQHRQA